MISEADVGVGYPALAFTRTIVRSLGFTFSRGLTRMYRGRNHNAGQLQLVGAILGPEFG